jgi:hypothetical protein
VTLPLFLPLPPTDVLQIPDYLRRLNVALQAPGVQVDHGGLGGLTDDDHPQYIRHSLAAAVSDFLVASGVGAFVKKTLAEVKTILGLESLAYKSTVATGDIDADAVTYATMQNVSATDKVLGRFNAGAGDVEEIACTAAGRALVDDADAATQRTTLGLGTAATKDVDGANGVAGLDANSRMTKNLFANFSNGDGVAWGIITTGTCGETLAAKDIVYGNAVDSRWWKAKADAAATGGPVILAFVLSGGAAGASCTILLWGTYGSTGWGLSVFAFYYLSTTTAGAMTTTAPSTSGHQVRAVGYSLEVSTVFFFRPTIDFGEKS